MTRFAANAFLGPEGRYTVDPLHRSVCVVGMEIGMDVAFHAKRVRFGPRIVLAGVQLSCDLLRTLLEKDGIGLGVPILGARGIGGVALAPPSGLLYSSGGDQVGIV